MDSEGKKSDFWKINIGHVITLAIYLITASFFFARLENKTNQNASEVILVKQDIAETKNKLSTLENEKVRVEQNLKQDSSNINALDTRVTRLEDYIPKIAVMANNIEWIKTFLTTVKPPPSEK